MIAWVSDRGHAGHTYPLCQPHSLCMPAHIHLARACLLGTESDACWFLRSCEGLGILLPGVCKVGQCISLRKEGLAGCGIEGRFSKVAHPFQLPVHPAVGEQVFWVQNLQPAAHLMTMSRQYDLQSLNSDDWQALASSEALIKQSSSSHLALQMQDGTIIACPDRWIQGLHGDRSTLMGSAPGPSSTCLSSLYSCKARRSMTGPVSASALLPPALTAAPCAYRESALPMHEMDR